MPQQDRDERAHLDQTVAADQLLGPQDLREDRVLDRAEKRRMDAEERQRRKHQRQALAPEAHEPDDHDDNLEELDPADQPRLLDLVGDLSGRRRKEDERRDEDSTREIDECVGVECGQPRRVERDENYQRILVDVVVGGAEELGPEEGRETTLAQEVELIAGVHGRESRSEHSCAARDAGRLPARPHCASRYSSTAVNAPRTAPGSGQYQTSLPIFSD